MKAVLMTAPQHDLFWDAGELGCGDLVVKLKLKFRDDMESGQIIKIHGIDEGLPEDMPAWCSLTKNPLIHAAPPYYYVQKKPIEGDQA